MHNTPSLNNNRCIMKKCLKCLQNKSINQFYKNRNGKLNKCKSCIKIQSQKYSKDNRKKIHDKQLKKRKELREIINKLKNKPCTDCNKSFEHYCMDFDHLKNKKYIISNMIHDLFSLKNIIKEINKTELVCILCHRQRTHNRKKENKTNNKYYIRNRNLMNLAKDHPCAICGIKYNPWQMDFDHIKTKTKPISKMTGAKQDTILKEIEKCQLLCALCHRKKTFENS